MDLRCAHSSGRTLARPQQRTVLLCAATAVAPATAARLLLLLLLLLLQRRLLDGDALARQHAPEAGAEQ